jgi:hypothetical protein
MSRQVICVIAIVLGLAAWPTAASQSPLPGGCPAPGATVPLSQAISAAAVKNYQHCDIVVEATFLKMGHEGTHLGRYNTRSNTVFQILEPGATPQLRSGGRESGTVAGTPATDAAILSELKRGDAIRLRGHPVPLGAFGKTYLVIFHAESVSRQ